MKGCVPQFEKWLQDNLTLVAGIFIGVALLQVGFRNDREALLFLGHRLTSPFIHRFLGFVWPRTWWATSKLCRRAGEKTVFHFFTLRFRVPLLPQTDKHTSLDLHPIFFFFFSLFPFHNTRHFICRSINPGSISQTALWLHCRLLKSMFITLRLKGQKWCKRFSGPVC